MKIAYIIVRYLLALYLLVSCVFYVVITAGLMPPPPMEMPPAMITFFAGVTASIYLMPLIKIVEFISVITFVTNRYVALGAVILFPISVNLFLLEASINQKNILSSAFIIVANLFIAYVNREQYKSLFVAKP